MAVNPYKSIALDHSRIRSSLEGLGCENLHQVQQNGGKLIQHGGTYDGKRFLLNVFVSGNGKCTIGYAVGFDRETFDFLARSICETCGYGASSALNTSIPRFSDASFKHLIFFLQEQGAQVETDEARDVYRLVRVKGPNGDKLTVKHFNSKTLQLQGFHAQVAAWALDIVQTLMPLNEVLAHQKAVYEVPLTVTQIKQDLESRIPHVHDRLREEVRVQLSSALALTKVGVCLEDHSAIAFSALRGLEGYCFQLLAEEVKVQLESKCKLGEFFDTTGSSPSLLTIYHGTATPQVQGKLVECYALWRDQRHRLFHMDAQGVNSRVLESRDVAVALVNDVLDTIEVAHQHIEGTKEGT